MRLPLFCFYFVAIADRQSIYVTNVAMIFVHGGALRRAVISSRPSLIVDQTGGWYGKVAGMKGCATNCDWYHGGGDVGRYNIGEQMRG